MSPGSGTGCPRRRISRCSVGSSSHRAFPGAGSTGSGSGKPPEITWTMKGRDLQAEVRAILIALGEDPDRLRPDHPQHAPAVAALLLVFGRHPQTADVVGDGV